MALPTQQQRLEAWAATRLIIAMNADTGRHFQRDEVQRVFGVPSEYDYWPIEGDNPAMALMQSEQGLVVFVGGTQGWRQWWRHVATSPLAVVRDNGIESNQYFYNLATLLANRIIQEGYRRGNKVRFYGHSLGGAVVTLSAMAMHFALPEQDIELTTFGSPKVGSARNANFLNGVTVFRYMTREDPVPLLPRGNINGLFAFGLGQLNQAVQERVEYDQVGQGVRIAQAGRCTIGKFPVGLTDTDETVSDAENSLFLSSPTQHACVNYMRCLAASAADEIADLDRIPIQIDFRAPTINVKKPTPNLGGLVVGDGYFFAERLPQMMFIPSEYRPKTQKLGSKSFGVAWGGVTVATGLTKSNAHVFAKRLSAWLRYLSSMSAIEQSNLSQALDTFLTAAAAGEGFNPTITLNP